VAKTAEANKKILPAQSAYLMVRTPNHHTDYSQYSLVGVVPLPSNTYALAIPHAFEKTIKTKALCTKYGRANCTQP
jgi:hypothetical protein